MKHKLFSLMPALLLAVMTGCSNMDTRYLGQDRPEDINRLLQQHEYALARQLTGKHASLDSPEIQARINSEETAYEETVISEARELQSRNDLLGAVQLLSAALQKVPHSMSLRELRNTIEPERIKQLQTNSREQLIARARYILDEQQLYREQANLESPTLGQRWEHKRNLKEAEVLSVQLKEHGQLALEMNDLDLANACLQLSRELHQTPEVDAILSDIIATEEAGKQVEIQEARQAQKKASIKKEKSRKKEQRDEKKKTKVLLAEAQQALAKDNLEVARAAVVRIPPSATDDREVLAIQDNLDQAVDIRVKKLIATGDTQYRRDNVLLAVRTWTKALSLDPDNQELRKRVERANKVLARLEELKRQQHKQLPAFTLPVQPTRVGATRASPQR